MIWRRHGETGQGLVEYSIIVGLSGLFALLVLVLFGGTLSDLLEAIDRLIQGAT